MLDGGWTRPGGGQGGRRFGILHLGSASNGWAGLTVTSARTATASLVERRGEGVDRRAARQEPLAGAVGHGTTGRAPPPIEAAVETVSG